MNLNPIASNMTELVLNDYRILFSYKTPVAAQDRRTKTIYTTQKRWSNTTTRHTNKWVESIAFVGEPKSIVSQPQEFFNNLVAEVK